MQLKIPKPKNKHVYHICYTDRGAASSVLFLKY